MIKIKPTVTYNGLTVVMSNPSRFDKLNNLLSGGGGRLFDEFIRPQFNRAQCEIRLKEDASPLLPNTKCILCLGESAAKMWIGPEVRDNHIGEIRGSPYNYTGHITGQMCDIPVIASFFPQDAADPVNWEQAYNKQDDDAVEIEGADEDEYTVKGRHGRTARRNYSFWLQQDIKKCKTILQNNGTIPARPFEPQYVIAPELDLVDFYHSPLSTDPEVYMYLDIETWYPSNVIKCFSFSHASKDFSQMSEIWSIPVFNEFGVLYYNENTFFSFLESFTRLMHRCVVVAHNGAGFDFLVLAHKYHIPIYKVEDTMIMQHRCFSDVEKSLGHCMSLWTWEKFHKDEGNTGYDTANQVRQTLEYCAKDVYGMMLIHRAIHQYSKTIPGLPESIESANRSIRPYLISTLNGIDFDDEKRKDILFENDQLMMKYLEMIEILIGADNLKTIAGKSKKPMPSSNAQCVKYFHDMLDYPVVMRGELTKKGYRNPSLGKKALLKLMLKHNNPVINIIQAYREVQKESSTLNFIPWKE